MNRRNLMISLAILTALTLIGQYIMLANTAIGETKESLPWQFWVLERSLWGLRALVEVGVVIYIGMTSANSTKEDRILWAFKIILIGLIIVTVGPIWAAYSLSETIVQILTRGGVIVWGLMLAGISATMLAGVSYAYKVQPIDANELQEIADLQKLHHETLQEIASLQTNEQILLQKIANLEHELQGFANAVQFLKLLPQNAVVQLLTYFSDAQLDARTIANETGMNLSTVRSALSRRSNGDD